MQIHQIGMLFGGGRRQFDVLPSRVELEIVRVIDKPEAPTSATASLAEPVDRLPVGLYLNAILFSIAGVT